MKILVNMVGDGQEFITALMILLDERGYIRQADASVFAQEMVVDRGAMPMCPGEKYYSWMKFAKDNVVVAPPVRVQTLTKLVNAKDVREALNREGDGHAAWQEIAQRLQGDDAQGEFRYQLRQRFERQGVTDANRSAEAFMAQALPSQPAPQTPSPAPPVMFQNQSRQRRLLVAEDLWEMVMSDDQRRLGAFVKNMKERGQSRDNAAMNASTWALAMAVGDGSPEYLMEEVRIIVTAFLDDLGFPYDQCQSQAEAWMKHVLDGGYEMRGDKVYFNCRFPLTYTPQAQVLPALQPVPKVKVKAVKQGAEKKPPAAATPNEPVTDLAPVATIPTVATARALLGDVDMLSKGDSTEERLKILAAVERKLVQIAETVLRELNARIELSDDELQVGERLVVYATQPSQPRGSNPFADFLRSIASMPRNREFDIPAGAKG